MSGPPKGKAHGKQHGLTRRNGKITKLYRIWGDMKARCNNPNKKQARYYFGKGIKYDPSWEDYEPFHNWSMSNGYEEGFQIHRIDSDKNYEPANCVWLSALMHAKEGRKEKLDAMLALTPEEHKAKHVFPKMRQNSLAKGISRDVLRRILQKGESLREHREDR